MTFQFTVYHDLDKRVIPLTFCQCQLVKHHSENLRPHTSLHFYITKESKKCLQVWARNGVARGPMKPKQFQLQFVLKDKAALRDKPLQLFFFISHHFQFPSLSLFRTHKCANFEFFPTQKVPLNPRKI